LKEDKKEFQSHDRPTMGKGNIQSMKWKVKKGKVERKGKKQRSQRHCESGRGERKKESLLVTTGMKHNLR
jgi:hypothetical protein